MLLPIRFQQQVTSELGLKLHQGKMILVPIYGLTNSGITQSKVSTIETSLQSFIPHMHVSPQEVCPFSAQQSFNYLTSFQGIQQ